MAAPAGAVTPGMIRWSVATELFFHLGVIGQAAYLADPAKRVMSVWVAAGLIIVPYVALLHFRHGEQDDETVGLAHLLAALWYVVLTLIVVGLAVTGYRPPYWIVYLVFMAPGAVISLSLIQQRFRDTR